MKNAYSNLPTRVRVGCYDYQLEIMQQADAETQREFGHTNFLSQKIRISPGMNAQRLANTFIHEVLHAINRHVGVNDESTEEECVTLGANGLCAFWQDNPEACLWWVKLNTMGRQE